MAHFLLRKLHGLMKIVVGEEILLVFLWRMIESEEEDGVR
jgi:hypothetical protein